MLFYSKHVCTGFGGKFILTVDCCKVPPQILNYLSTQPYASQANGHVHIYFFKNGQDQHLAKETLGPSILKLSYCDFISAPFLLIRDIIFLSPANLQPWHFQICLRRLVLYRLCRLSTSIYRRFVQLDFGPKLFIISNLLFRH